MAPKLLPLPLLIIAFLCCALPVSAEPEPNWIERTEDGAVQVKIYFFWSLRCPHCRHALPFVESLERDHPWIQVDSRELTGDRANVARYIEMAKSLGREARSVPAFFVCGRMLTGYDSAEGIGQEVLDSARFCRDAATLSSEAEVAGGAPAGQVAIAPARSSESGSIQLPFGGEISGADLSLPLFTLVIAGLDAFNPCAFFVLLFLLSLIVHARSRTRMLIIGGTFVFFSGLVYFLFMAAWLNLFLVVGGGPMVTLVAGLVAVVIGVLNTKDFFRFGQGPSLSIPDRAKPGLFKRMRGLLAADSMGTMLLGTVALALAANSYELLCTAGFPMVYTRVLTINELAGLQYYGFLAFYNLVYILPLLGIVVIFTATLGARKLSERQGRFLKLVSGLMMLGLGIVLLVAPERLGDFRAAAVLLGVTVGAAVLLGYWDLRRQNGEGIQRT
jgi:hypothetical protein